MEVNIETLVFIKSQLSGANFKRLLIKKNITKYRIHKDCKVSYQMLCNWQSEKAFPSDELAVRVAVYLGLMKADDKTKHELKKDIEKLRRRIEHLK